MAGRFIFGVLVAYCLLVPESLFAQGYAPVQSSSVGTSAPVPMPVPGNWTPRGYWPLESHHPQLVSPVTPGQPIDYGTAATARNGVGYFGSDRIVTTEGTLYDDFLEPSPLERCLSSALKESRFRMEYLLWTIHDPGHVMLGAPIAGIVNPQIPFPVFDFAAPPNFLGNAVVPNLRDISFEDINGIRGTWEVPLTFGAFELSAFALEQASDAFIANLPQEEFLIAISTLNFGDVVDNRVFLYNENYKATYTSDLWGAETKVFFDVSPPWHPIQVRPMVGFKYLNIQEQLRQSGQFVDSFGVTPPLTRVVDSDTSNNLYGMLLGGRVEFVTPWVTVGAEPSVMLGGDNYRARVTTENFRGVADGVVKTESRKLIFSPVLGVNAYVRVKVTENISAFVGYNALWALRITRPENNVYYNDNGFDRPPGVRVDEETTDFRAYGISVGGEIRFR